MSIWGKIRFTYLIISLTGIAVAISVFYPLLAGHDVTPDLKKVMNDLPAMEKMLENSPIGGPAAAQGLGALYQQKKQYADAERMYRKALSGDPDNSIAWFRLGVLYQEQEMWTEAAEAFEHSLKKGSAFSQTHNNLCIVYGELSRDEESLKACEEALRLEPDNEVFKENLEISKQVLANKQKGPIMIEQPSQMPFQAQVVPPPSEMKIDVNEPIEEQVYTLRGPKKITLTNGRSVVGDIVEKDEDSMWLEVKRGMRMRFSREDVALIEDT